MKRKLNICIVHSNRNAFSETFIRNHIKFLSANVYDLYGGWFPAFDKNDHRIADYFIERNVMSKLVVFGCKLLPAFVSNRLPSSVKGYPYDEALNKSAFRYFLKKKNIDVVLAEFMIKGIVVMDICTELKIPFVLHTHGGGDIMNKADLENYLKFFPELFQKVSRVISVDSYSSSSLLKLGLEKEKLFKIGLGIDLSLFSVAKPSKNDYIFFAVGRFVDKKAPYLTIIAFAEVLQKHPEAKLIIAGNGILFECCNQIVRSLKIEANVIFPGVLTPLEVAEYMSKSRAFVQHSVHTAAGDSEGIPVAILEAMACGLPVISTYHNGIADTITHGFDGLLVEENDIKTMSRYFIQLIEEPALADELGLKARKKIEKEFEMSKVINDLEAVINDAYTNFNK